MKTDQMLKIFILWEILLPINCWKHFHYFNTSDFIFNKEMKCSNILKILAACFRWAMEQDPSEISQIEKSKLVSNFNKKWVAAPL